jgi:ribosomal protein S18 acetylase RimI-like enzyme
MGREVMPLTAQHLKEASGVLGQAFRDDPGWRAIFAGLDDDERLRRMSWFFHANLSACLNKGLPVEIRDQDRIVAAATIYPPKAYPLPMLEQLTMFSKSLWHAGLFKRNTWIIMKRALGWVDEMSKEHPKQIHYYLEYVGVMPDCQGQGMGSSIITKAVLHRADQEQVGCYLETANPRNVPLYERLGFQTVREKEILGVPLWLMWRDPKQPSASSTSG